MTDLNEALSELISVHVGPGMGIPFEPLDFANETTGRAFATVIATILNAAATGQLIPLETCNARAAAMVDAAAGLADAQEAQAKKRSDEADDETQTDFDAGVLFGTEIGARVIAAAIRANAGEGQ